MPVSNVTYVGGVGTNVLVFEGTATRDFANTTWEKGEKDGLGNTADKTSGTNAELVNLRNVVSGNVSDRSGNK